MQDEMIQKNTEKSFNNILSKMATKEDLREAVKDLKATLASKDDIDRMITAVDQQISEMKTFNSRRHEDSIDDHEKRIVTLEHAVAS